MRFSGEGSPYHQLLDGGVLLRLPARGRLLVHDLHADVILGRNHSFQIWEEKEKSSAPGDHASPGPTLTQPSRQSWAPPAVGCSHRRERPSDGRSAGSTLGAMPNAAPLSRSCPEGVRHALKKFFSKN